MKGAFLFSTERLGFRPWLDSDLPALIELNQNPLVMKYFPSVQTKSKCEDFISRMKKQQESTGYCYFFVAELTSGNFVGFIGLSQQIFDSDFTPAVDIGWRLLPEFWGMGIATEGAKACLQYAWNDLGIEKIISIAPSVNTPSLSVMKKIGMKKVKSFNHPLLQEFPELQPCELYQVFKD